MVDSVDGRQRFANKPPPSQDQTAPAKRDSELFQSILDKGGSRQKKPCDSPEAAVKPAADGNNRPTTDGTADGKDSNRHDRKHTNSGADRDDATATILERLRLPPGLERLGKINGRPLQNVAVFQLPPNSGLRGNAAYGGDLYVANLSGREGMVLRRLDDEGQAASPNGLPLFCVYRDDEAESSLYADMFRNGAVITIDSKGWISSHTVVDNFEGTRTTVEVVGESMIREPAVSEAIQRTIAQFKTNHPNYDKTAMLELPSLAQGVDAHLRFPGPDGMAVDTTVAIAACDVSGRLDAAGGQTVGQIGKIIASALRSEDLHSAGNGMVWIRFGEYDVDDIRTLFTDHLPSDPGARQGSADLETTGLFGDLDTENQLPGALETKSLGPSVRRFFDQPNQDRLSIIVVDRNGAAHRLVPTDTSVSMESLPSLSSGRPPNR